MAKGSSWERNIIPDLYRCSKVYANLSHELFLQFLLSHAIECDFTSVSALSGDVRPAISPQLMAFSFQKVRNTGSHRLPVLTFRMLGGINHTWSYSSLIFLKSSHTGFFLLASLKMAAG